MGGVVSRRDRTIYVGSVSVLLVDVAKDIVFPAPMPGDYDIYIKVPQTGTLVNSIGSKTANGFRMNLSVSLAGTVTWAAVEIMN